MQVWNALHAARCKYRTQKIAISSPSHNFVGPYLRNEGMYRQSEKNLLSSNTSCTCPGNMVNFGLLTAEICWRVWGTPGNFNGFRILATLLQRRRWTVVNQTLHYVWPSPGLVGYIYTFGISCPLTEFCHVQNSLCVHLCTIAQVSRAISSQLRHLSTIGKKNLSQAAQ